MLLHGDKFCSRVIKVKVARLEISSRVFSCASRSPVYRFAVRHKPGINWPISGEQCPDI